MNARLSSLLKEFSRLQKDLHEALGSSDLEEAAVAPCQTCQRCKGTGRIKLPKHLKKVLRCVKENPKCTTEQIKAILDDDITINGISNRLSDLVNLGLVTRHREGKWFHYTLAK